VIAGEEQDICIGERLRESRELNEPVEDRLICRANGVKDVAGDDHDVGCELDDSVDSRAKGRSDVCLPLIDSAGSEPLILPVTEMQVGEMNQAHAA
jgi:hypothetical protein